MLYTIKDIRQKLSEINTRYVKVEIDGEIKGAAIMSDLQEQMGQYGESNRRRVRRVFLSGVEYDVNIGINLYPLSSDEFWKFQENREVDCLKSIRDAAAREVAVDNSKRIYEMRKRLDEERSNILSAKEAKPLVRWDKDTGLLHFNEDTGKMEKVRRKKEYPEQGLFARFKRWLKGDKGWKR